MRYYISPVRNILWILAIACFFCWQPSDNWSAEPEVKFNLLTLPSSRSAESRLNDHARIYSERVPLRACIKQLAEHHQFSYWIDRQVDADKRILLTIQDAELRECLERLAKEAGVAVGLVENVITFASADRLAAIQYTAVRMHDQLAQSEATQNNSRTYQAKMRPLAWSQLTTPSELADLITKQWGIEASFPLPHDLMNGGSLQACTLSTQLTLLMSGFDQCAVGKDTKNLKVLPLPAASVWSATYRKSDFSANHLPEVMKKFPQSRYEAQTDGTAFVGTTAAHLELLRSFKSNATNASTKGGNTRGPRGVPSQNSEDPFASNKYNIAKVESQPLDKVMELFAKQLGLKVTWDESLTPAQRRRVVTFEAKESTLDSIFADLAAQARLKITRVGSDVTIEIAP